MTVALPWNEIDTVLLDMDGTLLDLHFDNYFWEHYLPRQYAHKHQVSEQQAINKIKTMYNEKHGQLEWYSIDYWEQTLDLDIMALKQHEAHRICYRPYCEKFLSFLGEKNIEAVLVTNAHPLSYELKMAICPLEHLLSASFSSHNFGLAKEHPEFWHSFQKKHAFDKNRALFIDDNDSVLENAQRYGIKFLRSIKWPDHKQKHSNPSSFSQIESFEDILE